MSKVPAERPVTDAGFVWLVGAATAVVGLATLVGLGSFVLLDVDEPRFATASRHMARGGDWIVPWFNGAERFDKPILIYWLQAAAMRCFGASEFAARLPSALAVTGVVPMIAIAARRLGLDGRHAVLAGVAVATCGTAQVLARGATADALLLFVTAWLARLQLAVFTGHARAWTHVAVWVVGALAFLTKGPPALVAPLALALGIWWAGRRPRLGPVLGGLLLATGLVLAWAIPALIRTDGRFWTVGVLHHVVERSLTPFEGHGGYAPWWYLFYLVAVPLAFLPWSPYLLALREAPRVALFPRPGTARILAAWFWGTVLVFTLSTSKLPHYPLPAFPALGIAVASAIAVAARRAPGTVLRSDRWIGGILTGLGVAFGVALPVGFLALGEAVPSVGYVVAATFALGLVGAGQLAWRGQLGRSVVATAATAVIGFALVAAAVMPALFGNLGLHGPLVAARADVFTHNTRVSTYALSMPSLVFYLDRDIRVIGGGAGRSAEEDVLRTLENGDGVVVTRRRKMAPLHAAVDAIAATDPARAARLGALLDTPRLTVRGFLSNKGGLVELVVLGR